MPDGQLNIYPVPADRIDAVWPKIKEFVQEALVYDQDETTEEALLADLLTGGSILHVGFRDGEAVAFTISYLTPDHLFIWAHGGRDTLKHFEQFADEAAEAGVRKIRFGSVRPGWERMAEKLGFSKTTVTYERQLDG